MKLFSESVSLKELESFFCECFDNNVRNELNNIKWLKKCMPNTIYMSLDMYYIIVSHFHIDKKEYRNMRVKFYEEKRENILDFELRKEDL